MFFLLLCPKSPKQGESQFMKHKSWDEYHFIRPLCFQIKSKPPEVTRHPSGFPEKGGRTNLEVGPRNPGPAPVPSTRLPTLPAHSSLSCVISAWSSQHPAENGHFCLHHRLGARCHTVTKQQLQDETHPRDQNRPHPNPRARGP